MYFLRWMYREVNPMVLILGLVLLYFLFNLATCNSRQGADSDQSLTSTEAQSTPVVVSKDVTASEDVVASKDQAAEVVTPAVAAEEPTISRMDKNVALTDNDGKPVESALDKVFNDKSVEKDVAEKTEAVVEKSSILSRIFKQSDQGKQDIAVVDTVSETAGQVAEAVSGNAKKAAVAVGGAATVAVATAAAALEGAEPAEEPMANSLDANVTTDNTVAQVETEVAAEAVPVDITEEENEGGFFGLFKRSEKSEVVSEADITEEAAALDQEIVEAELAEAVAEKVEESTQIEEVAKPETAVELVEEVVEVQEAEDAATTATTATTTTTTEVETAEVETDSVQPSTVVAVENADSPSAANDVPPPPSYSANISENQDGLSAARRAFWDRDYATADSLYSEMMVQESGNAELIAEYGNMLLQSGQVEKTLDAYEKAAGLMIDQDRKMDAKPLIDYISSWDKDRADALINKVFSQ